MKPPRIALAAVVLVCATLVPAVSAAASYDPVASGSTRLTLDRQLASLLRANGIEVLTSDAARRRGRSFLLPVVGGKTDPVAERAELESGGTLLFRRGRRRVVVRDLEVKTKRSPLVAKVGGSQLKVASAGRVAFQRVGFGSVVSARALRMTAKFATRLGKKLRLHGVLKGGQSLGSLRSQALPQTLAMLPGGGATLTPAPEFLAKLNGLFVSFNPIAPAERAPGPVFRLPWGAEGTISPDAAAGVPRTAGALEFLQLGSGQVFWQELWLDQAGHQVLAEVDVEPSPTLPGKVGQVPVAELGPAAVSSDPTARTVTVTGAALTLSPQGADYFNQAFARGGEEFHAGEPLGSLSFLAQVQ